MNIVKVRYFTGIGDELSSREYTYFAEVPLEVGDTVTVPVRDTMCKAQVTAIDVPETEIATFKDKVKIIPAPKDEVPLTVKEVKTVEPIRQVWDKPLPPQSDIDIDAQTYTILNPRKDAAFISLNAQVARLAVYAQIREVKNDEDVKSSTDDLTLIANLKKAIEDKRTAYVKPFNDHVKEVNSVFKLLSDPLESADKTNRQKILAYRQEQERKRKEAEEINRLKEEAASREAALTGNVVTESGAVVNPGTGEVVAEINKVVVPAAPPAHVCSDAGTLGTSKVWKYELVDFGRVPDKYKLLNEPLVGKLVRAGERDIPGIRIYQEDCLRITAK